MINGVDVELVGKILCSEASLDAASGDTHKIAKCCVALRDKMRRKGYTAETIARHVRSKVQSMAIAVGNNKGAGGITIA